MMKKLLTLILLLFSLCATAQEYRDVIYLKNGSIIKGFYKELFPDDTLRMQTIDGGIFICPMTDVVRIAKEKTDMYVVSITGGHEAVKWRPKGYIGSFEWGMSVNVDHTQYLYHSFFTTHGYAVNRTFFFGAGIGLQQIQFTEDDWTAYYKYLNMPIYADIKCNLLHTRVTPYIDVRGGYCVLGFKGFYFNPSIGVSFNFTPRSGAYATVGYVMQEFPITEDGPETSMSNNLSVHIGLFF